ncbi:pseudouridine synthase [Pseudomonas sp. N040]|uniref:pseudouridine synthase n=1 Tax=Pseudomonas sp. N040 TaxID=2785325 RepID=UPI0018A30306|nr:pseudouridine synthase [Pseudomonas sp. N040]MBF7729667.1 pseudouridine synthase [Pseudomonas sp. N040]MBW7013309.1 pseudouridine synthase [Pseudomonas sp. N040]
MSLSSTHHAGVRPSTLHLPRGDWATVLDCLCAHFPSVSRAVWLQRMARGRVLGADGLPLGPQDAYREGLRVHYFREVPQEREIPFVETLLHVDEHLVVVDKPHFLPVVPSGGYVEQTLLARLVKRLDNPQLVPIHRIDRLTAGLVLFSANPQSRSQYQQLFRDRQIVKGYEAIAPALPGQSFPQLRKTRLAEAQPFFRMQEVDGPANSETRIEVREQQGDLCRYGLYPLTGKKHQLRVHLAALGAGICNDPFYPQLTAASDTPDDYSRPLKLLAQELAFSDPLSGLPRSFRSELTLTW